MKILCILDIIFLSDIWIKNIFSHPIDLHLVFLLFAVENILFASVPLFIITFVVFTFSVLYIHICACVCVCVCVCVCIHIYINHHLVQYEKAF